MTSVHCPGLRKGTDDFRQEQKEGKCQFLIPSDKKKKKVFILVLEKSSPSFLPHPKKEKEKLVF